MYHNPYIPGSTYETRGPINTSTLTKCIGECFLRVHPHPYQKCFMTPIQVKIQIFGNFTVKKLQFFNKNVRTRSRTSCIIWINSHTHPTATMLINSFCLVQPVEIPCASTSPVRKLHSSGISSQTILIHQLSQNTRKCFLRVHIPPYH